MNKTTKLPSPIERDIEALQAYRQYRIDFIEQVIDASCAETEDVLSVLRSDATFQLAEFYFLLEGFGIKNTNQFSQLVERHNGYIASLLKDKTKMQRMGLSDDRLLGAIFDGETKPRVLKIWDDNPGTIDQTSLARLLVAVMSDETARKAIVACSKAGLLLRQNSVYRQMLIRSTGKLESVYGSCLRSVRLKVQAER